MEWVGGCVLHLSVFYAPVRQEPEKIGRARFCIPPHASIGDFLYSPRLLKLSKSDVLNKYFLALLDFFFFNSREKKKKKKHKQT